MRIARRMALLLGLGLVMTCGLAMGGGHLSGADPTRDESSQGALIVSQPDALHTSAARLERDQQRDTSTTQRWAKHPLILLAVLAASFGIGGLSFRRARHGERVSRPRLTWWSLGGGRAPPLFQLSVI